MVAGEPAEPPLAPASPVSAVHSFVHRHVHTPRSGPFPDLISACRLTFGLLTAGACGFGDGLADVVAGSAVAVVDPGRASGPGMGGFRCAGRSGGLHA